MGKKVLIVEGSSRGISQDREKGFKGMERENDLGGRSNSRLETTRKWSVIASKKLYKIKIQRDDKV